VSIIDVAGRPPGKTVEEADLSRDNLPLSRSPVGGGRACGRYRRPGPPLRPPVADRSQGCNTTLVQPFSRLSKFR